MKNKKKKGAKLKVLLAVLGLINVIISVAIRIYDRKQVLKIIEDGEVLKVLKTSENTVK